MDRVHQPWAFKTDQYRLPGLAAVSVHLDGPSIDPVVILGVTGKFPPFSSITMASCAAINNRYA